MSLIFIFYERLLNYSSHCFDMQWNGFIRHLIFNLCCSQSVLYLGSVSSGASAFGLGLLLQVLYPGAGVSGLVPEGLQLPGERVLDLRFLHGVFCRLQQRHPPLLRVFEGLLCRLLQAIVQVLLFRETLAVPPQF